jgi:hypothetical protein
VSEDFAGGGIDDQMRLALGTADGEGACLRHGYFPF